MKTLQSLHQVFSWPKYIANLIVQSSLAKWPKLTTWCIWLAGQFMTSQPDHRPLFQKRFNWVQKVEKKWHHWGWDWSPYWISARVSRCCGTHLIPVRRTKIKVWMYFCKSPKKLVSAARWACFVLIRNLSTKHNIWSVFIPAQNQVKLAKPY